MISVALDIGIRQLEADMEKAELVSETRETHRVLGYEWKEGRLYRNDVATDWRVTATEEGWLATHPATATRAQVAYHDDTEADVQEMAVLLEMHRAQRKEHPPRTRRREGSG